MSREEGLEILKSGKLRKTACRLKILNIFMENNKHALSHADIEKNLREEFDRVTIYRNLLSFLDNGVIHKVPDDSHISKYALCSSNCSKEDHHDDHVHFKCVVCNTSECFSNIPIPRLKVPDGYQIKESKLIVEGICNGCS